MRSNAGLGDLDSALDALAAADITALPPAAQAAQLRKLGRALCRLQAEITRRVRVMHGQGGAAADGFASTQAFLRRRLRLSAAQAARQVTAAVALDALPDTSAAFAAGDISLEHAEAICRTASDLGADAMAAGAEKLLLEEARSEGPARVWRVARTLRQRLAPEREERRQARQFEDRWFDIAPTFDGAVSVHGVLDKVVGEVVATALRAFTPPASPAGGRTPGQRRADALGEVCRTALGAADAPLTGRQHPHVTVVVGLESLRGASVHDPALLGPSGEPICAETARRLACDSGLIPAVLGARGEPLDIGRLTRLVPTGIRRALALRDQGCRFPGCDRQVNRCDAHHVWFWAEGGPTAIDNLVLLCAFHHWLVHEGQWQLHYHAHSDTVAVLRADGTPYDLISTARGRSP